MDRIAGFPIAIRDPKLGIAVFAKHILGLPVVEHKGQLAWLKNSHRTINILRPGNRFGKSIIGAVKHLYHACTKISIDGQFNTVEEWERIKYATLNFGPGYEQAREILRMVRDIAQGNIHIPLAFQEKYGVMNDSKLKDWFITNDHSESVQLPYISTAFGVDILARSYSDMGAAFKMKGIAYISGDEVADIQELWTFTNGTLLPRMAQYKNAQIDYYGTVQAAGHDYMRMIEMAEEDMLKEDYEENGMFYVQKGSMYENPFLDKQTIQNIEKISDPTMRKQIIDGEYVETGDKYFGYERIQNAVDKNIVLINKGLAGRRYLVCVDFAGGESYWADFTVIAVIDYTEQPYKVVHFRRFKGGDMPIPMQYKLVEETFLNFRDVDADHNKAHVKLILDSSALGGKNAMAFLKHLSPISFNISQILKAEMLASYKIALDGGQSELLGRKTIKRNGEWMDENQTWGLIKFPNIPEIVNEHQNYKLEDKKIRQDIVMTFGMGVHYIELRRPKQPKNKMIHFDVLA